MHSTRSARPTTQAQTTFPVTAKKTLHCAMHAPLCYCEHSQALNRNDIQNSRVCRVAQAGGYADATRATSSSYTSYRWSNQIRCASPAGIPPALYAPTGRCERRGDITNTTCCELTCNPALSNSSSPLHPVGPANGYSRMRLTDRRASCAARQRSNVTARYGVDEGVLV
jgi:hypothetical protein